MAEVTLVSFGFAHGRPDPDSVLATYRLTNLPNPSVDLRKKFTGTHTELQRSLFQQRGVEERYAEMLAEIHELVAQAVFDGATEMTLAFGCQTGVHRSVAVVEKLKLETHIWEELGVSIQVDHRDLTKPTKRDRAENIKHQRDLKSRKQQAFFD